MIRALPALCATVFPDTGCAQNQDELQATLDSIDRILATIEEELQIARDALDNSPPTNRPAAPTSAEQPDVTLQRILTASTRVIDDSIVNTAHALWSPQNVAKPASLTLGHIGVPDSNEWVSGSSLTRMHAAILRRDNINGPSIEYGAWMEHSFFFLDLLHTPSDDPLHPSEVTRTKVNSIGRATGHDSITGTARWLGSMVGIDQREDEDTTGNLIIGDATVSVDFTNNPFEDLLVDVLFEDIEDTSTGGAHDDMRWDDILLSATGTFKRRNENEPSVLWGDPLFDRAEDLVNRLFSERNIDGQFYGPNHEEVGGVFLHYGIVGAFGAKRLVSLTTPARCRGRGSTMKRKHGEEK